MQTKPTTEVSELTRNTVLVQRHLVAELELVQQLEEVNNTLAAMTAESGVTGLKPEQLAVLETLTEKLATSANQNRQKRIKLLEIINRGRNAEQPAISIRKFIQLVDRPNQQRLEDVRQTIIDRLTNVHATMLGNQAVFHYSFDFYKKMVCGLLQCDLDESKYRPDGQSSGMKPGNFYRKAC